MGDYLVKYADGASANIQEQPLSGVRASVAYTPVGALLGGILGYATARHLLNLKDWRYLAAGAGVGAVGGGWLGHLAGKAADEDFVSKVQQPSGKRELEIDQKRGLLALNRLMFGSGVGKLGWGEAGILGGGMGAGIRYINLPDVVSRALQIAAVAKTEGLKTGAPVPSRFLHHGAADAVPLRGGLVGLFLSNAEAQKIADRSLLQYLDESKKPITPDFKNLEDVLGSVKSQTDDFWQRFQEDFGKLKPSNPAEAVYTKQIQDDLSSRINKILQTSETALKDLIPPKSTVAPAIVGPTVPPVKSVFGLNPEGIRFKLLKGGIGGGVGLGLAMLANHLLQKAVNPHARTAE